MPVACGVGVLPLSSRSGRASLSATVRLPSPPCHLRFLAGRSPLSHRRPRGVTKPYAMPNLILRWLDRVPIVDVVDRRNARVIQVLLLFLAITVPATVAFGVAMSWSTLSRAPVEPALVISLSFS